MEKPFYNYRATGTIAYLSLRKIAITLARKEEIETRTASRSIVGEIVDSLYVDSDKENPNFVIRDIYNTKASIRRIALELLTPT